MISGASAFSLRIISNSKVRSVATDPQFVRDLLAASGPDADAPVVRR
jgi:hypothetical protein